MGDETTYTNIYNYLFRNLTELQKRAYLARYDAKRMMSFSNNKINFLFFRFLVKLDIAADLETDNDISEAYSKVSSILRVHL